jgi:hypothetical protein
MRSRALASSVLLALALAACDAAGEGAGESESAAASAGTSRVRLTGDGVDLPAGVVEFGTPVEAAVAALEAGLGRPTKDTGVGKSFSAYGTCPGTKLRALEYGDGALVLLFGDVKGPGLTLYQWELTTEGATADVPRASALVGDVTTYDFGVGTTVAALRAGVGDTVTVTPADPPLPAQFVVHDQSSGISGTLDGVSEQSKTTSVEAGQACGE